MAVRDGRSKVKQSVILTSELQSAISRGADARDVSCSQIVREALRIGLAHMQLIELDPMQARRQSATGAKKPQSR